MLMAEIFHNEFIALKNDDNGIMKITAGTIESKEQAVQNWHNLDVTGGTFNGDVYTWSYDNSQGTATIGGSAVIDGNVAAVQYGNATAKSTVETRVELLLVLLKRVNMEMAY